MSHVTLNPALFESTPRPDGMPATPSAATSPAREQVSRRRFLQGVAAATAVVSCDPLEAFDGPLHFTVAGARASLWAGRRLLWIADASWLAGRARFATATHDEGASLVLEGIRYPGTDLDAGFSLRLSRDVGSPIAVATHALGGTTRFSLQPWLAGLDRPEFVLSGRLSASVGDALVLRQVRCATVAWLPTLGLRARAERGWSANGIEFSGRVDEVTVSPPSGIDLIDASESLVRTRWAVKSAPDALRMQPRLARGAHRLAIGRSPVGGLTLETAESADGHRWGALLAEGSHAVAITQPAGRGATVRSLAHEPRYARAVAVGGVDHAVFVARAGGSLLPFGPHVLSAQPVAGSGMRIEAQGVHCTISCDAHPTSLNVATVGDIAVSIRFPHDLDATVCPFSFRRRELSLDKAEVIFRRSEDAMHLRFRFTDCMLRRKWSQVYLVPGPNARMSLVLGPQAIREQAWLDPPDELPGADRLAQHRDWLDELYTRSEAPEEGRQAFIEAGIAEYAFRTAKYQAEEITLPGSARIAGDSKLVFRLRPNAAAAPRRPRIIPLTVSALLDRGLWALVIVRDAYSSEEARRTAPPEAPAPPKQVAPPDATSLEITAGLHLSPDEFGFFSAIESVDPPTRYRDLYRLAGRSHQRILALRAIAADSFDPNAQKLPPHRDDPFRSALDARDRAELVWLSSEWDRSGLLGTRDVRVRRRDEAVVDGYGIYVPRSLEAPMLMLSSMGASARARGLWDPPGLKPFALSVERWEHQSSLARSHRDVVVYKGFLLPLGIRATVLKITQREERKLPDVGPVSTPIQRFFIEVTQPLVEYGEHLAPHAGRSWPFRSLALLLDGPVEIDPPEWTDIGGLKQSAFRVCVNRAGFMFPFAIDADRSRQGRACLMFIDNTVAHAVDDLDIVVAEFPTRSPLEWGPVPAPPHRPGSTNYWMELLGSKVQYAPSLAREDTWFVTHAMRVSLGLHRELVNTPIIEASGKPPTYPEMASSDVVIPALNRLTGKSANTQTEVEHARAFLAVGFGRSATDLPLNESEVFLSLRRPVDLSFSGVGNRSGAVATPNVEIHHLSRRIGPMGRTDTPLSAPMTTTLRGARAQLTSKVAFNAADLFKPDAKLLGVLPMSVVFDAIGLDEVPRFVESVEHRVDAALGDLRNALCAFVRRARPVVGESLGRLNAEGGQSIPPALAPALDALSRIDDALADLAGRCEVADPSAAEIVATIAAIGADLEAGVACLRAVQQNPAVLLPAGITEVIAQWKALYDAFKDAVDAWRARLASVETLMREQVRAAEYELRRKVGAVVARELDAAASRVLEEVVRWVGKALDPVELFRTLATLVRRCHELMSTVMGWYDELESHTQECVSLARSVIDAAAQSWRAGPIRQHLQGLEGEARALDKAVRAWPISAEESCRAWFRRVEPTLDHLHQSWQTLLSLDQVGALPAAVDELTATLQALLRSLREELAQVQSVIARVPGRATTSSLNQDPAAFSAYLTIVLTRAEAVDATFRGAISAFAQLRVAGQGLRDTLDGAADRLHAAGARAIPILLREAVGQVLAGADTASARQGLVRLLGLGTLTHLSRIAQTVEAYPQPVRDLRNELHALVSEVGQVLRAMLGTLAEDVGEPAWVETLKRYRHLLPILISQTLDALIDRVREVRRLILGGSASLPGTDEFLVFRDALQALEEEWNALARHVASIAEAPARLVLEAVQTQLESLLKDLVPAEVKLDFSLRTELTKTVAEIFKPGIGKFKSPPPGNPDRATLELSAHLTQNLVTGASSAEFSGRLADFRLDLFDFIVIKFGEVRFEAKNGESPRLHPPTGIDAELNGCLAFVNQLKSHFQSTNGPYVLPTPGGIKAGYRFDPGTITLGTMVISDLVLDAGICIPFDDRAAVTSMSVGSRPIPCKLCITPYGGAAFFAIEMIGDRLQSIEASFEAGLVSVFDLVSVKGSGRVTFGIYFHQSGKAIALDGFFFAGGSATILRIITMSVSLRIGFRSDGESVTGYGEFSVEIGCSPFEWTLEYSVQRNIKGGGSRPTAKTQRAQIEGVDASGSDDHQALPVFLSPVAWRAFQGAFAD